MPEINAENTAENTKSVIKKGDFIELDFSAYTKEGKLFDTTLESDAKKEEIDTRGKKFEPIVVCVGEGMLLRGLDKALEGKEIGKDYEISLKPENAFGKRNPQLIKTVPLSAFTEMPHAGMIVNVDGFIARVASVTSGRALVDFNNPLAGKEIIYKVKIRRIVKDNPSKIKTIAKMFGFELENLEEKEGHVKLFIKKSKSIRKEDLELLEKKIRELVKTECEVLVKG